MKQSLLKQRLVLFATLVVFFVALGGVVLLVVQKHHAAVQRIADIEPRYARLLGLQAQSADLEAALERAKTLRAQYVFPSSEDAAQTGNAAQQRVRDIFNSAALQIISSQVLPAKLEAGIERIPITVRAEGDLLGLQSALAVFSGLSPAIFLDQVDVQSMNFGNADPNAPARLAIQFSLSVLREPA